MSRPRILVVAQAYPDLGGISGIIEMQIPELSQRAEVHLAAAECGPDAAKRLGLPAAQVHDLAVNPRWNPLVLPTSLVHFAVFTRRLVQTVKALTPDLILAEDAIHAGPATAVAGRLTGVPAVVLDHGTLTNISDPRWPATVKAGLSPRKRKPFGIAFAANRPFRVAAWRTAVSRATQVWWVGNELTPFFERAGGRARRYRQLVPADFSPPTSQEVEAARRRYELPPGARVVNVVSRLDAEKGLPEVARALKHLLPRYPDTVAVIAGTGHLEPDLRAWVADAGVSDAVRFVGRLNRPEIAVLHHASDIHLYAGTLGCAVSIALLEAMRAEVLPVVADVPTFHRELVRESGFVFRAGDGDDLMRALESALQLSPEELERRKRATREDLGAWRDPELVDLVADLLR